LQNLRTPVGLCIGGYCCAEVVTPSPVSLVEISAPSQATIRLQRRDRICDFLSHVRLPSYGRVELGLDLPIREAKTRELRVSHEDLAVSPLCRGQQALGGGVDDRGGDVGVGSKFGTAGSEEVERDP
jgi:hypothetical protein